MILCPLELAIGSFRRRDKIESVAIGQPNHIILSIETFGERPSTLHVNEMSQVRYEGIMSFLYEPNSNVNGSKSVLVSYSDRIVAVPSSWRIWSRDVDCQRSILDMFHNV